MSNIVTKLLFFIYILALFWIILFKLEIPFSQVGSVRVINLIPFHRPSIIDELADFGEMILNVIIFFPLGLYLSILFREWSVGRNILFFFLTSLLCELIQYVFAIGVFDTTDILTNTLGGIIGLLIFKALDKIFKNSRKSQKIINVIATTGTVLAILLLVLLKINNLWIFRVHSSPTIDNLHL